MTTTPLPPLPSTTEYGIVWTLKKGNAIYECTTNFLGDNNVNMERDENDIPIIPSCGSSANDDRDPGSNEDEGKLSFFHSNYKWNNVEISFSIDDKKNILKGFEIEARVYALTYQPARPDDPNGPTRTFSSWVPYRVKSATIISEDPNDGNTWVYDNPRNYGGIILFSDDTPVDKEENTKFVCGIDESAYNYIDVFDDVDFAYIPRNSYENKKLGEADKFQFEPLYKDVKDANGLAAPIYPMNAVTSFVPDSRETVTVTYKVSLDVVALDNSGKEIKVPIENPEVTIKQVVEQDTSDYIGQLKELGKFCQFENPEGFPNDELSPNYNYDYPYTMVSGYEGVGSRPPTTRGDDKNNEPLQRGDIWFRPDDNLPGGGERLTWNNGDIPEEFVIINPGKNYRDDDNALAVFSYESDHSYDKEVYPNGRPPRCFDATKLDKIPSELYVSIKTEKGEVVSVSLPENSNAFGWSDKDMIRIVGGDNNAEVRISISETGGWTTKFINKY